MDAAPRDAVEPDDAIVGGPVASQNSFRSFTRPGNQVVVSYDTNFAAGNHHIGRETLAQGLKAKFARLIGDRRDCGCRATGQLLGRSIG